MRRMRGFSIWVFALSFCLFAAFLAVAPAWGQEDTATITGTVTDTTGAAVANATVTARDVDRGTFWPTTTNADGAYTLPLLSIGNYDLTVEAKGFATTRHEPFTLAVNQVARVDFQIKVGAVAQTVEVTEAPPILQTDSTELGTLIDSHAVTTLPLATRNLAQLTLLAPGVVSPNIFAFQAPQTTFGTGRPYVNGAREQDNNFQLDGMDVNQADNNEIGYVPGIDAVQDFNIIAGNAPAEFGNYIGGVVVETLKSGTNQYHGDVFEYVRNTSLDANTWQNKAISFFDVQPGGNGVIIPRNPLHWNEFGATVGGPIIKNKLFFFADYQGSRFDTPASSFPFSSIPAAFRTGDFSSICLSGFTGGICNDRDTHGNVIDQLYDPASSATPATRTPFPNNQVPIRSTAAQNILNSTLLPGPNQTSYLQKNNVNADQGDLKIDWQPTDKDHVMGRYSQQYVSNVTSNSIALLPSVTREYPLKNFVVDYSRAISPTLVNDVRFGAQIFPANDQVYTNPTGQNLPQLFGIPGVQSTILPALNFTPYTSIGNAASVEIFHDNTYEFEDGMTWSHGKHAVSFGFEYYKYVMNDIYPGNQGVAGSFTFNGQFTGNTGTSGGNSVADFLLGVPQDVQEGTPFPFHLRNSLFGAFVQDDWRLTSHLTLNIGLRYEITTPRGDSNSINNVNFNLFSGEPEIGTNYHTYNGIDNFQPRLGIAWQPGWLPNTVFRAAYAVSTYMEGNGVNNMAVINPPDVVAHEENNTGLAQPVSTLDQGYSNFPSAACTAALLEAFSPVCLKATTVHATNPGLRPAVDQQWNLTVQHQFGRTTTVSAAYVGNKIDHMTDLFLTNQDQIINGILEPGPFTQTLVNAGANVRYNDSEAIQRYNALELTAVVRPYKGLQMQANYTWSKCLSNSLGYFGQYGDEEGIGVSQTNGGYFFFQNAYNQKADYGRCISDIASAFNGYMIYELPFGRGKQFAGDANSILNQVIGGWSIASTFNIHSGFAINPAANDQSGTGGGVGAAYRPNCVPGADQNGSQALEKISGNVGLQFLNPAAVTLPPNNSTTGVIGTPAGTFGNCGVGAFRGPGLAIADFSIIKQFSITERVNFQFMAQFLNLTNTPVFSAPSASLSSGTFGLVQSQNPAREVQFGLKLRF